MPRTQPAPGTPPPSRTMNETAVQRAMSGLLLDIDPATARRIATNCLRLAASLVAIAESTDREGYRSGAVEILALLSEGAPPLPATSTLHDSQAAA